MVRSIIENGGIEMGRDNASRELVGSRHAVNAAYLDLTNVVIDLCGWSSARAGDHSATLRLDPMNAAWPWAAGKRLRSVVETSAFNAVPFVSCPWPPKANLATGELPLESSKVIFNCSAVPMGAGGNRNV